MMGASILALMARGPHETRWFGWRGGAQLRKRAKLLDLSPDAVTEGVNAMGRERQVIDSASQLEMAATGPSETSKAPPRA